MDKNSIGHHATTSRTNSPNMGDDGDCLQRRENLAQVFFRRAGRFFSGISDAITGAFLSFAQSARNAWMHVEQAFSSRSSDVAVAHVKDRRRLEWVDLYDDDDDDEYIPGANPVEKNFDSTETKDSSLAEKSSDTPDFFGLDESSSASGANKSSVLMDVPPERVSSKEDPDKNLAVNPSASTIQEISNDEKMFNEFSERYDSDKGYLSISPDDPAFDSSCLQFAKNFQEKHPENANIPYPKDVQEKRKAATALLFADAQIKAEAAEKIRIEAERADKLAEQQRRQALPPGQADFEDFSAAYQAAQKTGRDYKLTEGSKFLDPSCLSYARHKLTQQPEEGERSAIQALLDFVSESTVQLGTDSDFALSSASTLPPPSPPPRWKLSLQNLLGNSEEMPAAHQGLWMAHHQPDQKNQAWQGLRLLLSPQRSPLSSGVVSDIQQALSYQIGSAQNDEYQLSCFELAKRLLDEMAEFDVGSYLANRDVVNRVDDQKQIIATHLKNMKSVVDILRTDLQDRIDQLSSKKPSAVRENIAASIPSISDLSDKAFASASADFNQFVEDFQQSNQNKGVYEFTPDRLKYRRPACVAIAQSVTDTYGHLNTLVDSDKERLAAATFLVNQYNLSSKH